MRISRQPSPLQIMIDKNTWRMWNYPGTMITNDARCTCEITSRTVKANAAFSNFLTTKLDLNLRKKLVKCWNYDTSESRSDTSEVFKCGAGEGLRSAEPIVWEMKYYRVKEERNILHTISRRKANWTGHILRRNCLLKHITEATIQQRIEVTRWRERWRKQLLDDLKETKGYWKSKQEALDHSMWSARFWMRYGPVVRNIREWMNELMNDWLLLKWPW